MNIKLSTKNEYRQFAKQKRATLDILTVSKQASSILKEQAFYSNSINILSYYPINTEINLLDLFDDKSKNWYLPKVTDNSADLSIHKYCKGDSLVENKWGLFEPINAPVPAKVLDLVIAPALMVDMKGYRLGYGAGFYDRLLLKLSDSCKIVTLIPEGLFFDSIPHDDWDIPIDFLVTEVQSVRF